MEVFLNFLNSKEHFYYVISSYCVVFFLLGLIFFETFYKVKKLQKKLNQKLDK